MRTILLAGLALAASVATAAQPDVKVTVGKAKPVTVEVTDNKVLVDTLAGPVKVEKVK